MKKDGGGCGATGADGATGTGAIGRGRATLAVATADDAAAVDEATCPSGRAPGLGPYKACHPKSTIMLNAAASINRRWLPGSSSTYVPHRPQTAANTQIRPEGNGQPIDRRHPPPSRAGRGLSLQDATDDSGRCGERSATHPEGRHAEAAPRTHTRCNSDESGSEPPETRERAKSGAGTRKSDIEKKACSTIAVTPDVDPSASRRRRPSFHRNRPLPPHAIGRRLEQRPKGCTHRRQPFFGQ